jgi:hypothetical protein
MSQLKYSQTYDEAVKLQAKLKEYEQFYTVQYPQPERLPQDPNAPFRKSPEVLLSFLTDLRKAEKLLKDFEGLADALDQHVSFWRSMQLQLQKAEELAQSWDKIMAGSHKVEKKSQSYYLQC